ncbi:MAG: SnoaL-like domain-containing protein [Phycisphaerae bacterium]|jgi:ketosteroid isomerase-like protein|nr:SnoaL-like domain-containing protein [Phycisphaerae bacterium]
MFKTTIMAIIFLGFVGCTAKVTQCYPSTRNGEASICCPPTEMDVAGVRKASDAFYSALNQMFVGNIAPMDKVWSHEDDVSQLGPMGGRIVGWALVGEEWNREASLHLGGKVVAEHLHVVAGPCMGYTVTDEVGQNMTAGGEPIEVRFRATNIFRKEKGGWKMVHHHTDLSSSLINATGEVD